MKFKDPLSMDSPAKAMIVVIILQGMVVRNATWVGFEQGPTATQLAHW